MPDGYPVQNPRVAWRVYDEEAVLVSPDDSTLHTLNAVGTRIWQCADGRTPVAEITRRITVEFDVEPERAGRDTQAFLDQLSARGLLTLADGPVAEEEGETRA